MILQQRGFVYRTSPSASLPIWDTLFATSDGGRNPAGCGRSRPFIRTMDTGPKAHFGPFCGSLRPPSLTQPNHGHFGTVVRSPPDQWVMRCQLGGGFESAALKRSEHGSNNSIRYGCRADRNRAPRGVAGADRRGARLGPSRERPPAEGPLCRASMGPSAGRLRRLVVHRSCEASRGVGHSASCCGLPMCATGCAGMQSAVEAAGGSSYEQPSERFLERPEVDLMRPRRARLA
jgi:hypothetical protein